MTFGSIYMEEHVEDPNLGGAYLQSHCFLQGPGEMLILHSQGLCELGDGNCSIRLEQYCNRIY